MMSHTGKKTNTYDLIIIGGGAAGYFCAIQCEERNPNMRILILEKSNKVLAKVKVSGGGRCNVTHACFDPHEMVENYPRGQKELLGPFHRFLCGDMMAWLADHGVDTHVEEDGRVFPISNKSQQIIDCFHSLCNKFKIEIQLSSNVTHFSLNQNEWEVHTKSLQYGASHILIATGSSPKAWEMIRTLGHTIESPVPSLFTFNITSPIITGLPGVSVPKASIKIQDTPFIALGPLLITHWGVSGPAVLKLSAWAARKLHEKNYKFNIAVNWVDRTPEEVILVINQHRLTEGKSLLINHSLFNLPKRLWSRLLTHVDLDHKNYASLTKREIENLCNIICQCILPVQGKSTFKDEFVTCGGVNTREINFKTMESKIHPGIYFAGEVINIDAITGGFNFQAAWTEAYIAAEAIVKHFIFPL